MKKISSILIILGILLTMNKVVYADTLSDYQKQLEAIKLEQQATTKKLTGLDQEIAQDLYDMMDLDSKMVTFSSKLGDLQKRVDEVNSKLTEQEKALQNSAQSYNSAEEVYITRLRVIYENGIPSMLDIFLSSESISDFFSKINVLTSILQYDKSLVNNMQTQKEYIDYIKNNIEIQKVQLEQLKYDTEKSSNALENAKTAKENKMNEMKSSQTTLKAKAQALAKQETEASKKIQSEIEKMLDSGGSFSGQFAWPVPGYVIITAKYNISYDPFDLGIYTTHTGVDIAGSGISGSKITAMESGTVTLAKYYGGYGNCVIIDYGTSTADGNKYKSLYGHAERLNVVEGQKVIKGQTVAFVGTTGNSSGPHVHLELYKNNKRVDALSYFGGMKFVYR
ncbi:MAG: peptidoglycan DD-metalloendopeptidase family protein [Clostridia bacterium]|nr:peptidoglycan DD-metalloendopeptidase family protein [Clostridia bacterium]MDD4386197.1 peptidoglycan DD-metalloendopeptidase family protein [Clostridia bacterium]